MKLLSVYKNVLSIFTLLVCCFTAELVIAKESINNVRVWLAPDNTRLVFDLSGPVKHKVFSLSNPPRVVIDITDVSLNTDFSRLVLKDSGVTKLRSGNANPLRIVLDMDEAIKPTSFTLKPNNEYGHRLVVDLKRTVAAGSESSPEKKEPVKVAAIKKEPTARIENPEPTTVEPKAKPVKEAKKPAKKLRDIVIALDAGHGGEDPGAIGASGLKEKVVVLAIAKELEKLIDAEEGFISRMIRRSDYYVSLRGRTSFARKKNADLFVSIHADAFKDSRARGASVWVLSNRGASSEVGRWLAQKENSSDLIGGVGSVSLEDKDAVLKGVLLDMSMTASRKDSREVANKIHKNIKRFAKMHKPTVERAGFLVLKSPDIPSILVETGFISNPSEEKSLKSSRYRKKMAKAIFEGIKAHFLNKPPAYTAVYQKKYGDAESKPQEYKVVSGDSLSRIAVKYGVSLASLKELNNLTGNKIRIGQRLQIPTS